MRQLRAATQSFHPINLRLIRDRETQDARFAFLEFTSVEASTAFIDAHGRGRDATPLMVDGRRLAVGFATPRQRPKQESFQRGSDWLYVGGGSQPHFLHCFCQFGLRKFGVNSLQHSDA